MDKPCWGPINLEKIFTIYSYIEFVTTPVIFNLNFPKNHDFDDLGKAITKILNLMGSNGPGGCVGAEECLERGLGSPRSNLI